MSVTMNGVGAMPQAWSGASMKMPPNKKMGELFQKIDLLGQGTINQDQFQQAFQTMNPPRNFQQAGADNIWAQLDPNNSGQVAKDDFVSQMVNLMSSLRQQSQGTPANAAQTTADAMKTLTDLGGAGSLLNKEV
ncbi:MAG: EF-hand domain-containing protein [Zetaproteobacteria bacterium]|nr:EF-hand domain-containing protein [Zetaproteobacteria bacterium]